MYWNSLGQKRLSLLPPGTFSALAPVLSAVFEVSPPDPARFPGWALLATAVAPARRAARIDPLVALRYE